MASEKHSLDVKRALTEEAKRGDRYAFSTLVEGDQARLRSWIVQHAGERLLRSAHEDALLQEVLFRALRSMPTFQWMHADSFFQWLAGIARQVILTAAAQLSLPPPLELPPEPSDEVDSPD